MEDRHGMVTEYPARRYLVGVLVWLFKVLLILKYGGSRAYPLGRSIFIGLIVGEIFAAAFWGIVPTVLVLLGRPYEIVKILPT